MEATTLKVPGATLYREVRGEGPTLLFVPGGNGDAGPFERVASLLADRYRTIAYDRRGFSRSRLEGAPPADRMAADVDDALRLMGDEPAFVFGSSSGAIVALDLLARHPQRVRALIAHEPPAFALLEDDEALRLADRIYERYRADGVPAAMQEFSALSGIPAVAPPDRELPPHLAPLVQRTRDNVVFWLEHELRQYPRFVPDVAALASWSSRLVLAGGEASRAHLPYRPNVVLAERLGTSVLDFPGGHVGYLTHAPEFAARLAEVLTAAAG
jgi:pimeloyl-ACP methyl ester carboxylesterase